MFFDPLLYFTHPFLLIGFIYGKIFFLLQHIIYLFMFCDHLHLFSGNKSKITKDCVCFYRKFTKNCLLKYIIDNFYLFLRHCWQFYYYHLGMTGFLVTTRKHSFYGCWRFASSNRSKPFQTTLNLIKSWFQQAFAVAGEYIFF